ncbi:MAG: type II CAAX endopeptidase family protein [Bacteroidota bacterium]
MDSNLLDTSKLKKILAFSAPIRLIIFIGALSILWLPIALPIYWLLREDSNLASILTMVLLFFELLWLWHWWGKLVYQEKNIYQRYGLVKSKRNFREFFQGLAIGFWLCLGLFIVEALFGWLKIVQPSVSIVKVILEGLLSATVIALAEELLFRGWLLDELQRDYGKSVCIWVTAIAYAVAHFLKPVAEIIRTAVTFPALVLLGVALVLAKYKYGDREAHPQGNRLGICIGIHAGLVWAYYIVNVGKLIKYTNRVPVWVTGIDGNPIAGVMGLLFLSGLTMGIILKNKSAGDRSLR